MSSFETDEEKQEQSQKPITITDDVNNPTESSKPVGLTKDESTTSANLGPGQALDWDDLNDTDNPRNWPFRKRVFNTAIPSLMALLVTFSSSSFPPAVPLIMKEFNISQELAIAGLSLYVLGLATGPLFSAPLSELYGRKYVYMAGHALLLLFTAGVGSAQNIETILICRFFAGFLGSGSIAIGAGTVADVWDLATDGGPAALGVILSPNIGITIGYVVSAYFMDDFSNNWRFSQWVILIVGSPMMVASPLMSETYKRQILVSRLKKRGTPIAAHPHPFAEMRRQLRINIVRPVHMMFTEPLVGYLSLYTGFAFGMIFSFLASYSYVFEKIYGFSSKSTGLTFLAILPGFVCGLIIFGAFDKTLYARARIAANGNPAPEHRLYPAMVGSIILPIALFWFAWAPRQNVHWIVPVLSGLPFGIGVITVFLPIAMYLIDVYRSEAGASALAANGILRYVLGSAFPLFTIQMYNGIGVGWAGSVFGFVAILMMPLPWVFFKYGKALRARSSYDISDF